MVTESATESKPPRVVRPGVRVKGWGKSPPRLWQQGRHGKPRMEQVQAAGRVPEWPAGRMHPVSGETRHADR